jgi:PKD repeat protein
MKKNRLVPVLLLAIILFTHIIVANSVSEYEISGFVTMKDSSPLNKVKIELLAGDQVIGSDSTNKKGFYRISKIIEDNSEYSLRASNKRIQTKIISFETTELEISIDIILNQYPSARIDGPEQGYVNDLISFSASRSSDPDEDPLTYHWDFGDGSTSNEENPTQIYSNLGVHTVSLQVEDPDGASDNVQTMIEIINGPPTANANGPYTVYLGEIVQFSSDGSNDPDGNPLEYHWNFGDRTQSFEANPQHIYDKTGKYNVILKVKNIYGAEDQSETICNVQEYLKPVANANGPYTGYAGESIEFSSDGSHDPDGEIMRYSWEFEDGQQSEDPSPRLFFQEIGVYSVSLTVFDAYGESGADSTTVKIQATPPLPPIAECNGPYSGKPNSAIYFSSSGSFDPNGDPLEYYWSFGNGESSSETSPSILYSESGTYSVTLTVTDHDLESSTDTTTCIIKDPTPKSTPSSSRVLPPPNEKPVAMIEGPSIGEIGISILFSSNGSYDPEGGVITYRWDFGDGITSIEENPTHIFADAGTYEVILTIYDEEGKKDTYNTEITILNPNIPPIIILGIPSTGKTNESLQFTSDECYDPDGEIKQYVWDFGDYVTKYIDHPLHSYRSSGIYDVSLTVTDNRGTTTREVTSITIHDNVSPIPVIIGPNVTKIGQAVDFSANSSYDTDGEIIEYAWDFGDGATSYLAETQHIFTEDGEKTITLILTDNNQDKNDAFTVINVSANVPPEIHVATYRTGIVFKEMVFNSESIDTDGEIVSTFWAFGDGETALGDTAIHNYTTPGTYLGSISVTDDNFETSTEYIGIEINEPLVEKTLPYYSITMTAVISIAYLLRKPWLKFINSL